MQPNDYDGRMQHNFTIALVILPPEFKPEELFSSLSYSLCVCVCVDDDTKPIYSEYLCHFFCFAHCTDPVLNCGVILFTRLILCTLAKDDFTLFWLFHWGRVVGALLLRDSDAVGKTDFLDSFFCTAALVCECDESWWKCCFWLLLLL